ncbi:biotin--[acetyl-CoA-carboxylase] ligase [Thermococcus sp.]
MKSILKDSRIKRHLLSSLREREVVSGDEIAGELGVSRVAVWKHVRELIELGYGIKATPKGYRLLSEPGKPYPWELEVRSYYLTETGSTMNVARRLAERGERSWTFVIAEKQRAGRGRLMRRWVSREGGLYFSLILRPKLRLADAGRLLPPVCSAIMRTLGTYGLSSEAIENGVYIRGRKIAGVLVEVAGELDMVRYAIVGVGLNVANPVPENATSLMIELGDAPALLEVSRRLFNNLGTFLKETLEVGSDDSGQEAVAHL